MVRPQDTRVKAVKLAMVAHHAVWNGSRIDQTSCDTTVAHSKSPRRLAIETTVRVRARTHRDDRSAKRLSDRISQIAINTPGGSGVIDSVAD